MLKRRIRRDISINIAVICYIVVIDVLLTVCNDKAKNYAAYAHSVSLSWNYWSWVFELLLGIVPLVSLILLISALRTI